MKKNILVINIIAFSLSLIWIIQSNYQLEPIILAVTLIATLIGLIFTEPLKKILNRSKIKGNRNKISQKASKSSNFSEIEGDSNDVNQF